MDTILLIEILIILLLGIIIRKALIPAVDPYRFSKIRNWAKQGKYFNFDGYPIFYYDSSVHRSSVASKPVLLLLHGYPTSSMDWLQMLDRLEQQFHVIAPDFLGYGLSAKPQSVSYSIFLQTDMVEHLIDFLNVNQFHILAHDVGDTVAQELLARQIDGRPYQIQSTVLLNGGLFPETNRALLSMRIIKLPVIGPIMQELILRSWYGSAINSVFGPMTKRTAQELDEMISLLFYKAPYNLIQQLECFLDERVTHRERWLNALNKAPKLNETAIRIRLIDGPLDPISGQHMVDRYRQIVENPDICVLAKNIGHYPNLEDPQNTLRSFLDFHNSL